MMGDLEQMKEISQLGRDAGLTGADLNGFVTARLAEIAAEREREERDKEREERDKEREERDKQRAFELERQRVEMEKEIKLAELQAEAAKVKDEKPVSTDFNLGLKLDLGKFDAMKESFDDYLTKFEMVVGFQKIPQGMKAMALICNLTGKALEVVNRLSPMDRSDYEKVKFELLEHFQLTEEGYRKKFRSAKPEKYESPRQYAGRLKGYLQKWVMMSDIDETFDSLMDLMLREQFVNACPRGVEEFIKEGQCDSLDSVIDRATVYVGAHGAHTFHQPSRPFRQQSNATQQKQGGSNSGQTGVARDRPTSSTSTSRVTESHSNSSVGNSRGWYSRNAYEGRGCYACGNPGHIKRYCPMRRKGHSAQGMTMVDEVSSPDQNMQTADSNEGNDSTTSGPLRSNDSPLETGQAGICIPQVGSDYGSFIQANDDIDKLGMAYDQLGAMLKHMPVVSGRLVNGNDDQAVSVLRDTGCSTCVVKASLVDKSQFSGVNQAVMLIDGTVRNFPVAKVYVDSPFYVGEIEAMCMPNSLCDVVIGNIPRAREPNDPDMKWIPKVKEPVRDGSKSMDDASEVIEVKVEVDPRVMAVETRAQKERKDKPSKGLKVSEPITCMKPAEFSQEQRKDLSLKPLWDKVGRDEKSKYRFISEGNVLYRQKRDVNNPKAGVGPKCIVLPKSQREKVMKIAHESLMGGHVGINNTMAKIKTQFFWPGMAEDVANFCRSCDICQKQRARVEYLRLH